MLHVLTLQHRAVDVAMRGTLSHGWIEAFVGSLGGGKTYSAVCDWIIPHLARGGTVCTNINLNIEALRLFLRSEFHWELQDAQIVHLSEEQIPRFHVHTPSGTADCPVMIVIDEAHLYLDPRDTMKHDKGLTDFWTQARKCDTRVIFISQHYEKMDVNIRRMVTSTWRFRDLRQYRVGIGSFGFHIPFPILRQSQWDAGKKYCGGRWRWFDSQVWKCYESKQILRSIERAGVAEKFENKYESEGASVIPVWIAVLVLAVGLFSVWRSVDGIPVKSAQIVLEALDNRFGSELLGGGSTNRMADLVAPDPGLGVTVDGYRIVAEVVLSIAGDKKGTIVYQTENDIYREGAPSKHGLVLQVRRDGVLCRGWGGGGVMVIADLGRRVGGGAGGPAP